MPWYEDDIEDVNKEEAEKLKVEEIFEEKSIPADLGKASPFGVEIVPKLGASKPTLEPEEDEEESSSEEESATEKPKNIRIILMYSEVVDKVIICVNRKGKYLEARGRKEGLKDIEYISPYLENIEIKIPFEDKVKNIFINNIDYNVIFDEEVGGIKEASKFVVDWAKDGKLPEHENSGGWWDNEDNPSIWNTIDR